MTIFIGDGSNYEYGWGSPLDNGRGDNPEIPADRWVIDLDFGGGEGYADLWGGGGLDTQDLEEQPDEWHDLNEWEENQNWQENLEREHQ